MEELWVCERKFDGLTEVSNLSCESSDILIGNFTGVLSGHVVDVRVHFSGEDRQDSVGRNVHGASDSGFQFTSVDLGTAANNVAGSTALFNQYSIFFNHLYDLSDKLAN